MAGMEITDGDENQKLILIDRLSRFFATRAFLIAFFCTCFDAFDLPVFWPILLMYFILLFILTMRRQIQHMIKYRYVPWNIGKKSYNGASIAK